MSIEAGNRVGRGSAGRAATPEPVGKSPAGSPGSAATPEPGKFSAGPHAWSAATPELAGFPAGPRGSAAPGSPFRRLPRAAWFPAPAWALALLFGVAPGAVGADLQVAGADSKATGAHPQALGAKLQAAGPDLRLAGAETPAPNGLDSLVVEALRANGDLAEERLSVRQADADLSEAKRGYWPSLALSARLSARSGNIIDLGRLVNPADAALNGLLHQDLFPTNVDLKLPARQETAFRVTQPLLALEVPAAVTARSGLLEATNAASAAEERRLAAEVRTGYLEYAKALRLAELYDSTLILTKEAVRVEQSLLSHDRATPDQVLRAQADQSDIEQRRLEAERLADLARQSCNLLLGRPVDAPLARLPDRDLRLEPGISLDSALARAEARREELAEARGGIRAALGQRAAARAEAWPDLIAALDWGVQGESYRFGPNDRYTVGSLVLQWTLFDGGRREARRSEANTALARSRQAELDAKTRVELDVRTRWQAAAVAHDAESAARARLKAARRSYELVARRHEAGAASLLELLDARTNFTAAAVNEAVTTYEEAERCVDLERAAALYPPDPDDTGGRP